MFRSLKMPGLATVVLSATLLVSTAPAVAQSYARTPNHVDSRRGLHTSWPGSSSQEPRPPTRTDDDSRHRVPRIVKTLASNEPAEVDVDPATGRVYVANFGDNTVTVRDPHTDRTIATILVGNGPGGIVFDRGRVYVANAFDGTISVIDSRDDKVVSTIDTGTTGLNAMVLNHRTHKLYVAVYRSEVLIYDLLSNTAVGSIADDDANFLAINEQTNKVYITNYDDATVNVVAGWKDQIVDTIPVGPAAFPDDCYETNTCTVNPAGPDGIAVNTRTNRLYVNNVITGTLVTIDGNTDKVVNTIQQKPGQFWSAIDEAANRVYSTNFAESTLSVLDGRTNRIIGTVQIGGGFLPAGCFNDQETCTSFGAGSSALALSHQTGKLYVPNFSGGVTSAGTVTVLSTRW